MALADFTRWTGSHGSLRRRDVIGELRRLFGHIGRYKGYAITAIGLIVVRQVPPAIGGQHLFSVGWSARQQIPLLKFVV